MRRIGWYWLIGIAHNASRGGTIGTASIVESLFHQHGHLRSTLEVAVRVAAVVASRSGHLGPVRLARTSGFSKLRLVRCD